MKQAAVDKLNLEISDKIVVTLKQQGYFDPWAGTREVTIDSMPEVKRRLDISPSFSKKYFEEQFRESGLLAIRGFAGVYVGNRIDLIKVQPFYGLQAAEAEYFIIPVSGIESILFVNEKKQAK